MITDCNDFGFVNAVFRIYLVKRTVLINMLIAYWEIFAIYRLRRK